MLIIYIAKDHLLTKSLLSLLLKMEIWRRLTTRKISENKPLIYMKTAPNIALNSHPYSPHMRMRLCAYAPIVL